MARKRPLWKTRHVVAPSKLPPSSPSASPGLRRSCIRSSGSECWCFSPARTSMRPLSSLLPSWLGLGIGNLVGGVVADRVSRRAALTGFAAAELAIALFSLVSRSLVLRPAVPEAWQSDSWSDMARRCVFSSVCSGPPSSWGCRCRSSRRRSPPRSARHLRGSDGSTRLTPWGRPPARLRRHG